MAETRVYATGRRKEAAARVWLQAGNGSITVNHKPLEQYFPRKVLHMIVNQPFVLTEATEHYDVWCTVRGGGHSGQAGAIRHGLAHALCRIDQTLRPKLKKAGMLTRDSRRVERKKYGQPGARKRFQYSKR